MKDRDMEAISNNDIEIPQAAASSNMDSTVPKEIYKTDLTRLHDLALLHGLHVQFREGKHLGITTPYDTTFNMEVIVGEFVGLGSGPTKQKARLQAAKEVVKELETLPVPDDKTPYWLKERTDLVNPEERNYFFHDKNPLTALLEVLTIRRQEAPTFTDIKTVYRAEVPWYTVEIRVGDMSLLATAPHKKQTAKHIAAAQMLELLGFGEKIRTDNLPTQGCSQLLTRLSRPAPAPRPVKKTKRERTEPREVPAVSEVRPETVRSRLPEETETPSSAKPSDEHNPPESIPESECSDGNDPVCSTEVSVPEVSSEESLQNNLEPTETAVTIQDPVPHEFKGTETTTPVESSCPSCPFEDISEDIPETEAPVICPVDQEIPVPSEDFVELEVVAFDAQPLSPEITTSDELIQTSLKSQSTPEPHSLIEEHCSSSNIILRGFSTESTEASAQPESCTSEKTVEAEPSTAEVHCMVSALAKKLLNKSPMPLDAQQQVNLVQKLKKVESRVLIPDNIEFRARDLRSIGKEAAKSLLLEFHHTCFLLMESEESFIQNLAIQLRVHINIAIISPSSTKHGNIFSRGLKKLFRRNRISPGPVSDYLSSGSVI